MWEMLLGAGVVFWLLYHLWTAPFSYWKRRGFPYLQPKLPYGNSPGLVLLNEYTGYSVQKLYREMGDKPYAGVVLLRRPHLVLKDPEVIKNIMLKDFTSFTDRINVENLNHEPLNHHLFNLGGDKWKGFRLKWNPTFTSGKLKLMFPLVEKCCRCLENSLEKIWNERNGEVDAKEIMLRFSTKVIGTCAFGLEIDSLENEENHFMKLALEIFSPTISIGRQLYHLGTLILPGLEKVVRSTLLSEFVEKSMFEMVNDTVSYRKSTGFKRNDFIDLMVEISEQGVISVDRGRDESDQVKQMDITFGDLVAQVFVFLAAGFETSSSVSSYCLFELAENQDIQDRLREEILKAQPITYQSVQDMVYLDMVVRETMRKYPALPVLTRKCTKTYKMADGGVLEKGMRVIIPVYGLHHDPTYFPDPDKFDPERFTPENKSSRPQFSYLPFGEGPRNCIGLRFGLLKVKMAIGTILTKYRILKTPSTVSPLQFVNSPIVSGVGHPIKLQFTPL